MARFFRPLVAAGRAALLGLLVFGCESDDTPSQERQTHAAQASAEQPASRTVTFRTAPPRAGRQQRVSRKSALHLAVEFWTEQERWGTNEHRREEEYVVRETLLKPLGRAPGKVKITYEDYRLLEDKPDAPEREDAHLEGRTYIVDRTHGEFGVTTEQGEPVSEAEKKNIQVHYAKLGEVDPVVKALGTQPIRVGKEFPLRVEVYEALLAGSQGRYEGGRIEVAEVRDEEDGKIAVLEWNAKFERNEGRGMKTIWNVDGTTEIAVMPARVVRQRMKGVIRVEGRTRKGKTWLRIEGEGTMSDNYRVEPLESQ